MNVCPVCGAKNIQLFMKGVFDCKATKVMECGQCGLQFLHPLMTEKEEEEYYAGYYTKQQDRHYRKIRLPEIQRRAFEHYDQYRANYLELISGCRTILEIGSGTGGFLRFTRQYNPTARLVTVERCRDNVDFINQCFGDSVEVVGSLEGVEGSGLFDLIGAFGVLEHVRNSQSFLYSLRKHISTGGRIALNVPNKANALVYDYALEEFRKFTYMKQHYYTFTEQAFEVLAAQTALQIEKFHYMQVWGLDNHLSWLRYGEPRDFSDITRLLSQKTIDSYNSDMIERKKTDLMMAVLRLGA
jgi:2-polyprenyl-3-methyl-5-hydroxy-6-metoxy-1,4-benzoquinol methylase